MNVNEEVALDEIAHAHTYIDELKGRLADAREALRYVAEDARTLPAAKTTAEAGLRLSSSPTEGTQDAD